MIYIILYYIILYYIIFYYIIYLLNAIGLKPGGSSTAHTYTQTLHIFVFSRYIMIDAL